MSASTRSNEYVKKLRPRGDEKDRRYTKIVVNFGTHEYEDEEQGGGKTMDGAAHREVSVEDFQAEEYERLDADQTAALDTWRDLPKRRALN
jgi:hypothetical protein